MNEIASAFEDFLRSLDEEEWELLVRQTRPDPVGVGFLPEAFASYLAALDDDAWRSLVARVHGVTDQIVGRAACELFELRTDATNIDDELPRADAPIQPNEIWVCRDDVAKHGAAAAMVIAHIRQRCQERQWWRVSYQQLAEEVGLSRDSLRRIVPRLRAAGVIDAYHFADRQDQTRAYRVRDGH